MSYSGTQRRFIGLCSLVTLIFMVLAASAQAKGEWFVVNKGEKISLTSSMTAATEQDMMVGFSVAALNIKKLCQVFTTDAFSLSKGGSGSVTLLLGQCEVRSIAPDAKLPCEVSEPIAINVAFLLILHEITKGQFNTYILVSPQTGTVFVVVKFTGAECTLPEEVKITGLIVLQEGTGKALETNAVKHLLEQATAGLFLGKEVPEGSKVDQPDGRLKFGAQEMRLDGSAWAKLTGAHAGLSWSALGITTGFKLGP